MLPISNGGTGANNLSSLAQALAGTGQLGGVPRLVGVFTTRPRPLGVSITITGLTPGHLLLWHVIANQTDRYRDPVEVELFAPTFSVDSGLLFGMGLKQKFNMLVSSYMISRFGFRGENNAGQNMDMAIIVGSTVRLTAYGSYDDYPELRFYQL